MQSVDAVIDNTELCYVVINTSAKLKLVQVMNVYPRALCLEFPLS